MCTYLREMSLRSASAHAVFFVYFAGVGAGMPTTAVAVTSVVDGASSTYLYIHVCAYTERLFDSTHAHVVFFMNIFVL